MDREIYFPLLAESYKIVLESEGGSVESGQWNADLIDLADSHRFFSFKILGFSPILTLREI